MSSSESPVPVSQDSTLPLVIQGGMGIGVSSWQLARAVSMAGQLGVVSGTAIDSVIVRRLQDGDPGGHVRRAAKAFPIQEISEIALQRYFLAEGRAGQPYRLLPMYRQRMSVPRLQLTIFASFVEVWLAKEGHDGKVGVNLLTKVQMPNLPTLYGAMLAGVDYVLMGAGIPREIPGMLDALAKHEPAALKFDVAGDSSTSDAQLTFEPKRHFPQAAAPLRRPRFLAIVSAASLATTLARKANGQVDGFIIEGFTAGGHNAPPRGTLTLDERGAPVYGERDVVDLAKIRELGLPFWLAGGMGSPSSLRAAVADGAAGIQVGTLFAFCDESGVAPDIRERVLAGARKNAVKVITDPRASPTGYPFKVVDLEGLPLQDETRVRNCDVGYLRTAYRTATGSIGYRCSAEPLEEYVAKGGEEADTVGRRCLCNGLLATIGQAQPREEGDEKPLVTSGDDVLLLNEYLAGRERYSAAEVLDYLMQPTTQSQ